MKELLRTNNPVLVSRLRALLDGAGIAFFVADFNASILDGSIGALPQRFLVAEDEVKRVRELIQAEGLGDCLPDLEPGQPS